MALLTCYRKYCSSRSILLCYISSLAAADLLFAILSTIDVSYFFLEEWPGGNGLCKIQGTLIEISYTASILTLVAISHERSRSVRSTSLARNRSVAQRTIVIKILWIVAIVVCAPLFYGYATKEENGKLTLPEYEVGRQRKTNVLHETNVLHASSCADFCLHFNIYHLGTLEDFASFANAY